MKKVLLLQLKKYVYVLFILATTSVFAQERVRIAESPTTIPEVIDYETIPATVLKEDRPMNVGEEKSANGNCANASLLVDGVQQCYNFSTDNSQTGETSCVSCASYGLNFRTIWYILPATTAQTTVNLNTGYNYWLDTWSIDNLAIYGPYTSQANATAACIPSAAQRIHCIADYTYSFDPLFSYSFATTPGSYYLVQITNCEDPWDLYWHTGCIWFNPTPANDAPTAPAVIDNCGVVFNGTNIGYSPSTPNGLPAQANLDGNNSTTCSGCPTGADVPYVINNDSWFRICASSTSTYNVLFNNISGCINNNGLQMSIFTGTPANLTNIWNAANPSVPGSSQTSPNFILNTGQCAYLLVDGFAGDQCNYSYTLNAVTPCVVLGATILSFDVVEENRVNILTWKTEDEVNLSHFNVLTSVDGLEWINLSTVLAKNLNQGSTYNYQHVGFESTINYYKLRVVDFDGTEEYSDIFVIDNSKNKVEILYSTNLLGQQIDTNTFKGLVIDVYSDGTSKKRYLK